MVSNENMLEHYGGLHINSLNHILSSNNDEAPKVIQTSHYYDQESVAGVFTTHIDSFNIFSLNCQSINAKTDEIKIKIEQVEIVNCNFDSVCLQEYWMPNDADLSLFKLDNYNMISKGKTCSARGLVMYLHNSYRHKNVLTNVKSDIWEGQFISVINEKTNNKIIIGNIYRPPRDICENYQKFNKEFTDILLRLQKTKGDIAIVGDYNIDSLKVEQIPIIRDYLDTIMTQGFFPTITLPTRFSDLNGTLIDNVLCRLSHTSITNPAGIIVTQISDHFSYFVCINNMKVKKTVPKYIYSKQNSDRSIHTFKAEVKHASIYDKLDSRTDANPSSNYDILDKIISQAADTCMLSKRVKYNKHKHNKSRWITAGIMRSLTFRDKMYANMKHTPTNTEAHANIKTNLKTYNTILRHSIEQAKTIYYQQKVTQYTNNFRNTWKCIKYVTSKTTTKTQLPQFFKVDGKILTENKDIANKFNNFFTNIVPSLASNISATGNKTYKAFLNPPCTHNFTFSACPNQM